jgi:MoaA/NifB/PqqE/SkfB family radical SAM enzyme
MCDRNKNGGEVNQYLTDATLSLHDIHRIFPVEFVQQLKRIYMCGNHGDPIFAPDTLEVMKYFRSINPSIRLEMITNGGARSIEWWSELATVVDQVEFSVDGLEDTNHLYRQGVSWKAVETAIDAFTSAGGNAKWTFLVFNYNEHQVEEAEQYAKLLGVKKFVAKKSGRFFSSISLKGKTEHQALSRKGTLTELLSPPVSEKYQNKALGKEEQIIQFYGSMPKYLDVSEIECKVAKTVEIYISAEGLVFPCCWTAGRMYKWWRPLGEEQIWDHINKVGLDNINAKNIPIQDIVEGEFFQSIEDSWGCNSVAEGKLEVCALKCNKEFDPYKEQWTK